MNIDKILIILGEPQSTFNEILFKFFHSKKFLKLKKKIILIGSKNLFQKQMQKLGYNIKLNIINDIEKSNSRIVNIINVNYEFNKVFTKISNFSNSYIKKSFDLGIKILNNKKTIGLINGPISKKKFLNKKFSGITEYLAYITNTKNEVMLIYNKNISVSPITTHLPLSKVSRNITKKKIINNVSKIKNFYKLRLRVNPNIAILGLNPHCESTENTSEEEKIIKPAINSLKKKKFKVNGPFSADTFFIKKNIRKYDVVIGMYHDQVITPIKTLYNFDAINLTLGLPFIRISPDHGPNTEMLGKNISDPSSLFCAIDFFSKIK